MWLVERYIENCAIFNTKDSAADNHSFIFLFRSFVVLWKNSGTSSEAFLSCLCRHFGSLSYTP